MNFELFFGWFFITIVLTFYYIGFFISIIRLLPKDKMNEIFNQIFYNWTDVIGVDLIKIFFGLFIVLILVIIFIDNFY